MNDSIAKSNSIDLDEPTRAPQNPPPLSSSGKPHDGDLVSGSGLPSPGTNVGEYELLNEIARGAMGVVYRARHRTLDRIVAIKMVLDGNRASEELRERFDIEARAAAALDHPGIVPVFDVGQWQDCPYFAMAYVEGESLANVLRDGPIESYRAAQIAKEVADAICHSHEHQIIHRDLKPANIMIETAGASRVTDFGVSKLLGSGSEITQMGELIGTPHYMPPEQAGGSTQPIGPAADVYSIGAVLFAMLTGRPPFQAASPVDVVAQVVSREPLPPSALIANVPPDLEVITLKCLRKRAIDRYASANELAEDLRRFLVGEPILARPPGWMQRARLLLRTHVWLASVSGSVALLLVALTFAAVFSLFHVRRRADELADKLDAAEQQMALERRMVSKLIASSSSRSEIRGSYEAYRLATSAIDQMESDPDLSMQLALASVEVALSEGIDPPKEILSLLRDRLMPKVALKVSDLEQTETEPSTSPIELLRIGRRHASEPLSEIDRKLFGIESESHLKLDTQERIDE